MSQFFLIRWSKYRSFSFSIRPSNEYSGLIYFRMDWLHLLAVQGTLKSFFNTTVQKHQFFSAQLSLWPNSHIPHMTTGKTLALTIQNFIGKVMSLLFNILSRLVIAFLPRSRHLFISWLHSPFAVILEPPPKVCHCFHCFTVYLPWSDGTGCHDFRFLKVEFWASFFILLFHFHQEAIQFLFTFCHKGGVICTSEVDISPGNLASSLC